MRPPAHAPVPPSSLLLLPCPRRNCRCVQLLLLLLLLLLWAATARAGRGRGRRGGSVAPDLLPPWLPPQQVVNMTRDLTDSWGACGYGWERPQECRGRVHHLRHHGRGRCDLRPEKLMRHVCDHKSKRRRVKRLIELRPPVCGLWARDDYWRRQVAKSAEKCHAALRHLLHMEDVAGAATCRFSRILARYDCPAIHALVTSHPSQGHDMCSLCQEAYRYWVCSQLFPYYEDGVRIKPCRRFCHDVEQKCPYFLPKDKPVAGEPTFLCEGKTPGVWLPFHWHDLT